jgi:hypothetical protein
MPDGCDEEDTAPSNDRTAGFDAWLAGASPYVAYGIPLGGAESTAGPDAGKAPSEEPSESTFRVAPAAMPGESVQAYRARARAAWKQFRAVAGLPAIADDEDSSAQREQQPASDTNAAAEARGVYLASEVKDCGAEFGEPWYEVRACGCKSRFCKECCVGLGLALRQRLVPRLEAFHDILMVTLTLDPELHSSAATAYRYCKERRCVSEFARALKAKGVLHSPLWFCANEWQKKSEMIHFHMLLDASHIPFELIRDAWNRFRPASAGPIIGDRPGFGSVWFSAPECGDARHAANYACKYVIKYPDHGFPDWVLDLKGQVHRYSTSRGFWDSPKRNAQMETEGRDKSSRDESEEAAGVDDPREMSSIRERIANCRKDAVLVLAQQYEQTGGELKTRYSFEAEVVTGWPEFLKLAGRPDQGQRIERISPEMAAALKSMVDAFGNNSGNVRRPAA